METNILPIAQENLERVTHFKLEIGKGEKYVKNGQGIEKAQLHLPEETLDFFAKTKKEVRVHQLPQIFELAEQYKPFRLIGGQIFPNIKKRLREKDINWIDAAGNMFGSLSFCRP